MQSSTDPRSILEQLDLREPQSAEMVVRVFAERMAQLIAIVNPTVEGDQTAALTDLYCEVISRQDIYDPSRDPNMTAWFYRQGLHHLLEPLSRRNRRKLLLRLPKILSGNLHGLSTGEIASILGQPEGSIERQLANQEGGQLILPDSPDYDLDGLVKLVLETLPGHVTFDVPPEQGRHVSLLETVWILAGLAVILAMILLFNSGDLAVEGIALFPTATPQLPKPVEVDSPMIRTAPQVSGNAVRISFLISPVISADGRYVAFSSNLPNLVPGDTNGTFDVFLYDTSTENVELISRMADGTQFQANSFSKGISAGGRWVVFEVNKPDGTTDMYLVEPSNGELTQVDRLPDGTDLISTHGAQISSDGSTVVMWFSAQVVRDSKDCPDPITSTICNDLLIFNREAGTAVHIPLEFLVTTFYEYKLPTISDDGSLIAFTIDTLEPSTGRLRNANEVEAVVYDWRNDHIRPLNLTASGSLGNGMSYGAAISGDGRFAVFTSEASDLVPEDTNDSPDIFLIEMETGQISRINLTPDHLEADKGTGETANRKISAWYTDISSDGRSVLFASGLSNMTTDMSSISCGTDAPEIYCFGLFLYDRESDQAEQLDMASFLDSLPTGSFVWEAYMLDQADRYIFSIISWTNETTLWTYDSQSGIGSAIGIQRSNGTSREAEPWSFTENISGPEGWINEVAVDPSGQWFVAGGQDGTVIVTNLDDGQRRFTLQTSRGEVNTVAVSPDGHWIAAGTKKGAVLIWDAGTGDLEYTLSDHPGSVLDVDFAPDSRTLAVGGQRELWIWKYTGDDFVHTNSFAQPGVNAVAYSPDGQWLATTMTNEVWIRRAEDGAVLARIGDHTKRILDLSFSPTTDQAYLLATSSEDGRALVWELTPDANGLSADHLVTLQHSDWVSAVAFSPDGAMLATGGFDSSIHLWEIPLGNYATTLNRTQQDQILSIAFAPEGSRLVMGTVGGIRMWNRGDRP